MNSQLKSVLGAVRVVWRDLWRRQLPIYDVTLLGDRASSAISWLLYAQKRSNDGGVPAWFDLKRMRWAPSYPETTGYLIPTLLRYSQRFEDQTVRTSALEMANYLTKVQRADGAIPAPRWVMTDNAPVYVFDTGQAMQGLVAAWQATGDARYLEAAERAGDWLVSKQADDGAWYDCQFGDQPKAYDARIGWILVHTGQCLAKSAWTAAGKRALQWAATLQEVDGWWRACHLEAREPAVTHTIAYAMEGVLEGGLLLGDERLVTIARRTADALLGHYYARCGFLPGYWAPGWKPLTKAVCLTGDAQIARCWLRLHQAIGNIEYLQAAERLLAGVAAAQLPADLAPELAGAIPGSLPVWGPYLSWRLPNWAAKFFLDAWLEWECQRA